MIDRHEKLEFARLLRICQTIASEATTQIEFGSPPEDWPAIEVSPRTIEALFAAIEQLAIEQSGVRDMKGENHARHPRMNAGSSPKRTSGSLK